MTKAISLFAAFLLSGCLALATQPVKAGVRAAPPRGAELWAATFGPAGFPNSNSIAASPDGKTAFVANQIRSGVGAIAYQSGTGTREWQATHPNAAQCDNGSSLAVSPDGQTVFVTGDCSVIAFDAATGTKLWASTFPDNGGPIATAADTGEVFVTGLVNGPSPFTLSFDTVAYDAGTGHQLWAHTHGPDGWDSEPFSITVDPRRGAVFVTGDSVQQSCSGQCQLFDGYSVIGYNAATGAQLWATRQFSPSAFANFGSNQLAVSPDGRRVYIAAADAVRFTHSLYRVVAYRAADGTRVWMRQYSGTSTGGNEPRSITVSPNGRAVFVTGTSFGGQATGPDYATIAYNAATGARDWVARYNGPRSGTEVGRVVAVSPDGRTVYVTGLSGGPASAQEYATIACNATTGARIWVSRYTNGRHHSQPFAMAIDPRTGVVFVTGQTYITGTGLVVGTVAYRG